MTDPAATGPIPLRVLVVDPDDRIRESITRLLPIGGRCAVVGSAGTTTSAEAIAESFAPDVAVIDSRLPDECADGFVNRLRAIVPGIRIVVLNWNDDATEPAPTFIGADAYIRKTFRPHELIDAVISAARVPAA